jgi:antirestriction protein ArdC
MTKGRAARRARSKGATRDIYAETTAKIVAQLEAGTVPWVQPWGYAAATGPGLPRNALTGRSYSASTCSSCGARCSRMATLRRAG